MEEEEGGVCRAFVRVRVRVLTVVGRASRRREDWRSHSSLVVKRGIVSIC